jgi:hypothetical protein
MGEYAKRKSDNEIVKIGTENSMYYLRYEDRDQMTKEPGSLDFATTLNLFWRLPFPDEDDIKPGEYRPTTGCSDCLKLMMKAILLILNPENYVKPVVAFTNINSLAW